MKPYVAQRPGGLVAMLPVAEGGPLRSVPLRVSSRRVAHALMERIAAGQRVPPPQPNALTVGLLRAYLGDLRLQGRSRHTLRYYRLRLVRLCDRCGWVRLRDITAKSFLTWRAKGEVCSSFADLQLSQACLFLDWLVLRGFLEGNPLCRLANGKGGAA